MDLRTMPTSSRVWSCNTLADGVDHLSADASQLEEMERELERQLQASSVGATSCVLLRIHVNVFI